MKRYRRLLRLRGGDESALRHELEDELAAHVQLRADALMRAGLTADAARAKAQQELQRVDAYREHIIAEDLKRVDKVQRTRWLDELVNDLRFGVRQLLRDRSFTLLAVLTLAVGIGVNLTVFTLVDRLFLRPLPFPESERLVSLTTAESGYAGSTLAMARVAERSSRAYELAGLSGWGFTITGAGPAEALDGAAVTTNLFGVLGVKPLHGRDFIEADRLPGQRVAILSYGLWQRRYGGSTGVIGESITIDGQPIPVVGVMPASFAFPNRSAQLWLPIVYRDGEPPADFGTQWIGRLRPNVSMAAARSAYTQALAQMREDYPELGNDFAPAPMLQPVRSGMLGRFEAAAWILYAAVTLVLLIACVNVANLLLTRAHGRAREMAIRVSLGARRGRLIRQLVTESAMLAAISAALAVVMASYSLRALLVWLPEDITAFTELTVDARILLYAILAAALTVVLCGLAPALSVPFDRTFDRLKSATRTMSASGASRRTLRCLVMVETALSVLLAIGAGLMLQSFWRLRTEETGFNENNVLAMQVTGSKRLPDEKRAFHAAVRAQINSMPGVIASGAIQILPLGGSNWNPTLTIEGRPVARAADQPDVDWRAVTTDFFRTMQIPLLRGRLFDARDNANGAGVALISERLARRYFPNEDPIGKRISTAFEGAGNYVMIIGITGDMKDQALAESANPIVFRPHEQIPINPMTLLIRTQGPPLGYAQSIEAAIRAIDQDAAIKDVQPLARVVGNSVAQQRLLTLLLSAFGMLAVSLGAVGLYGVISYIVGQRHSEFSIRAALGAQRADLMRLVLSDGLLTVAVGVAMGAATALLLTESLRTQLYEVQPLDLPTFLGVPVIIFALALIATLGPARRAAIAGHTALIRSE